MSDEERNTGWRWLLEKRRWLWMMLAIVAVAAGGWTAWRIGLRWLLLVVLSGLLFITFHPLECRVKWRLSWRGQRGEAWFRYLFGALGVGVSGSPAGARVFVEVGPMRREVFNTRTGPQKPPEPPPTATSSPEAPTKTESPTKTGPATKTELPRDVSSGPVVSASAETSVSQPSESVAAKPVLTPTVEPPSSAEPPPAPTAAVDESVPSALQPAPMSPATPPVATPTESKPATATLEPSPVSTTPVAETAPVAVTPASPGTLDFDQDIGRLSPPPTGPLPKPEDEASAGSSGPSLRERLRALRRRFRSTWQKIRKWYRIARDIWNRATEPCRRLLWNLWASISFLGPRAHLRYGLAEPHIVGMLQGILAPLAGILMSFGALIRVEPVFAGPTIWCRGETGLRVHPWRLIWAFARLAGEREVWRGARDAWRAWKERKTASAADEKAAP